MTILAKYWPWFLVGGGALVLGYSLAGGDKTPVGNTTAGVASASILTGALALVILA